MRCTASPAGPNSYLPAIDDLATGGPWTITVTAVRPGVVPATAALDWTVPPGAAFSRQPVYMLGGAALGLVASRTRRTREGESMRAAVAPRA